MDGRACLIRVNEFPAEELHSLLVEGDVLADLEDWPTAWVKPLIPGTSLDGARRAAR